MRLVHYSAEPITSVYSVAQSDHPAMKPRGLWVSDDDADPSWPTWCQGEVFGIDRLAERAEVVIRVGAMLVQISDCAQLDSFTEQFKKPFPMLRYPGNPFLDWASVAEQYQGIIITPYLWSRRLESDSEWYYGWDCASGCIWDAAAVLSVVRISGEGNAG